MEAIGKFFTTIILAFLSAIIQGFVIMKLWGWFIVTIFALNAISIVEAIGIGLVVGLLTTNMKMDEDANDEWFSKLILRFVFVFLFCISVLFEGWLVHLFM